MALRFGAFIDERDRCRKRDYVSGDRVLRAGYFCNTDRRWDHTSVEMEYEIGLAPVYHRECVETVVTQRLSGSARHSERPGRSGTFPILRAALRGELQEHIRSMPFSGRKTYRAVLKKTTLASAVPEVAKRFVRKPQCKSLRRLHRRVMRYFRPCSTRRLEFHALQVACDLHVYGLVDVEDASDCPLATGSRRGLKWVRQSQPGTTVKSLARELGKPAHSIQTSLCEYDKYRRWTSGKAMRRR